MRAVVGIDLGTTNTVVSVVRDGQPVTVEDSAGSRLIPSVVSFHPSGQVLVGRPARERRLQDAANTVFSIKRLIGRSWGSPEVEFARKRLPFEMREGPGLSTMVTARSQDYSLPEISAFVLQKAKSVAEAALGTDVDRAVITVPASFNDLQRAATKVAGRIAGLEVLRILNEPTAAALAHGFGKGHAQRIAIYDFGGGTFDLTLIDLSDNVFEVLSTVGDTFLGGDDLDNAIAELMADDFLARYRYDARTSVETFDRLRLAAEQLKIRLGSTESATVEIEDLAVGVGGKTVDAVFSMTRADLEKAARPIVDRTFQVCDEALRIAKLSISDFDHVLLVGGSTRMSLVKNRVANYFGQDPRHHANPDEVVALGAAIQASALTLARQRQISIPMPPESPAVRARQPLEMLPGPGTARPPSTLLNHAREPSGTDSIPRALTARQGLTASYALSQPARTPSQPRAPDSALSREQRSSTASGVGQTPPVLTRPSTVPLNRPPPPSSRHDVPSLGADRSQPSSPSLFTELHVAPRELPLVGVGISAAAALAEASRRAEHRADPAPRAPTISPSAAATLPESPAVESPRRRDGRSAATVFELDDSNLVDGELDGLLVEFSTSEAPDRHRPTSPSEPRGDEFELPLPGLPDLAAPSEHPSRSPKARANAQPEAIAPPQSTPRATPLLLDVTPISLSVETVGGYCDVLIERNTKVPCEQRRVFVTSADHQTSVTVRVCQGESRRFDENTVLGAVLLDGLRDGRRGEVAVEVGFALDTDGILGVRATDVATQREAAATLKLVGGTDAGILESLARRHAMHQIR